MYMNILLSCPCQCFSAVWQISKLLSFSQLLCGRGSGACLHENSDWLHLHLWWVESPQLHTHILSSERYCSCKCQTQIHAFNCHSRKIINLVSHLMNAYCFLQIFDGLVVSPPACLVCSTKYICSVIPGKRHIKHVFFLLLVCVQWHHLGHGETEDSSCG